MLATEIRYRIFLSGPALKEFLTEFSQMLCISFQSSVSGLTNNELPLDPMLLISVREWMVRRQPSQRNQYLMELWQAFNALCGRSISCFIVTVCWWVWCLMSQINVLIPHWYLIYSGEKPGARHSLKQDNIHGVTDEFKI